MIERTTAEAEWTGSKPDDESGWMVLIVRQGGRTQVVEVPDGVGVMIGRSPGALVCVHDRRASRRHAVVRRAGDVLHVEDLGSRNGTRVNRETLRRSSRRLETGDVIQVGGARVFVTIRASARAQTGEPTPLVIADPAMVRLFEVVRRVASLDTTVLILGETGVGKEVVAESLHERSRRADGPFVRLNCGSLPASLLESELFGHEKGAFTGAVNRKIGYLEAADGGTLFLDEVAELEAATQVKLLRVLESMRFMRLGATREISIDVRIISATNCDLETAVAAGRFREDLYYRLNAFVLRVPPLRDRPNEIPLLAEQFARRFAFAGPSPARACVIAPDALDALRRHRWPGNIRELRNAIEHATVLAEGSPIRLEHLPATVTCAQPRGQAPVTSDPAEQSTIRGRVSALEQDAITVALAAENGNQTRAAERLGISRRSLIYKMGKYRLRRA